MYALANIKVYNDSNLTTIPSQYKSSFEFFNLTIIKDLGLLRSAMFNISEVS